LNKDDGRFHDDDLRLLKLLAVPAATAIENAQLYQKAQKEIAVRRRMEKTLEGERALLTQRVAERTADLSAANAELSRASRLKDEFLASMSHELRTPLNAVLGMSEALLEEAWGALNKHQKRSLRIIEESGRHLLDLINDILDVSKIEAGKLTLNKSAVSVLSVCQASVRFVKQDALKKRIHVQSHIDDRVTSLWADERRLKQILVNLLTNAVKFTAKDGEIGLEVRGDTVRGVVDFVVWDTGIGISEEDMARLFRPFVQLDSRLNRQFNGTGLGLSLVYRMTELHGGSVTLASEVGQGSQRSRAG
jgi:signal transduction histidine kinase